MLAIAALFLVLATAPAEASVSMRACLGPAWDETRFTYLAKQHDGVGEAEWKLACRQARDANERRLSLVRFLLTTDEASVRGYDSALRFSGLARQTPDPLVAELYERAARDQAARQSLGREAKSVYAGGLSPLALKLLDGLISAEAVAIDADNRQWLAAVVARRGWFTIGRDGASADGAAWLLVQHGDADRDFQHAMIKVIEPLTLTGESEMSRFPSLYDRWAAGAGQPQRFGLQGACTGPGQWEPQPIGAPSEVDVRRNQFGMSETLLESIVRQSASCR